MSRSGTPSHRRRLGALLVVLAATATAGCGTSDSDTVAPDQPNGASAATTVARSEPATTGSPATTSEVTTGPPSTASSCPPESLVSSVFGRPMVVDANASVSAAGFCPYTAGDGSGDVSASITFTTTDVTADSGGSYEDVSGVGERALWEPTTDTLAVWTGSDGLLVSILGFGQGAAFDEKQLAVALSAAVLAQR